MGSERSDRVESDLAPPFDEEEFMASLPRLDRLVFRRPFRRLLAAGPDSSTRKAVNRWAAKDGLASAAWNVAARLWLLIAGQIFVLYILDLLITRGHGDTVSIVLVVLGLMCCGIAFVHGIVAWVSGKSPRC
jgi:hypothetical protein